MTTYTFNSTNTADYNKFNTDFTKLNFDIDQLINRCIILNKGELTATVRLMLGRDIILRFINILPNWIHFSVF